MTPITLFNGDHSTGGAYIAKTLTNLGYPAACRYAADPGDYVVGWGYGTSRAAINGVPRNGKLFELRRLTAAGIPVPVVMTSNPRKPGWLGRIDSHAGGSDLLNPPETPNFWTKFVDTVLEYRIHVFLEYGDKLAVRVKRDSTAHPWMRNTWEGGWHDEYAFWRITQETQQHRVDLTQMVETAEQATRALGYTFGAVDIAWTGSGPVVWEVNSQPYIPGEETAKFYARGIIKYYHERR